MAAAKKQGDILDPEKIISRTKKTERVFIESLDSDIVVRKLPAMMLEDMGEGSSLFLTTIVQGVEEPEMTEDLVRAFDVTEASEIYDAVEAFNPGVLSNQEEVATERRKAFPTRT